jgi:hypothetical protein
MTSQLTVEQRAKVASEVTGRQYYVVGLQNEIISSVQPDQFLMMNWLQSADTLWVPDFTDYGHALIDETVSRSQALALIEWLSKQTTSVHLAWDIIVAIKNKDIPALESLCYELMETKQ